MRGRKGIFILFLVIAFSILISSAFISRIQLQMPRLFQKGIAFTGYSQEAYSGWQAEQSLQNLKKTNACWISLLVTGYQDNIESTYIDYHSASTPSDDSLRHIISYAHQLGLKVMLKPHVDLLNDPAHWRGQIGLNFDEALWQQWFNSYQQFILHYAAIAAESRVEQFCLGCELDASVSRAQDWRQIIASVKQIYPGPLVYADDS